jgi:hypothetical protein
MTTLDARAQHAAAAIHDSVATFTPTVTAGDIVRRRLRHQVLNYAAVVAVVALAVMVGGWLRAVTDEPDVADTVPPQPVTTTTVVQLEQPVVVVETPDIVVPTEPEPEAELPQVPLPPVVGGGDAGGDPDPPAEEPVEPVDTEPPYLEVTSPEDGAVFETKVIRFEGVTEPGASVTAGPYEADVAADGTWGIALVLSAGGNGATFTATDAAGNTATARVTVYYEPPAPPPEKEPPAVEFTAFATYGTCELDPPYDVYHGTAQPGAKITVTSAYGSGSTKADAEGHWEVKVFFPEAPYGEVFLVTVKDDKGNSKKLEFVSLAGA